MLICFMLNLTQLVSLKMGKRVYTQISGQVNTGFKVFFCIVYNHGLTMVKIDQGKFVVPLV